MKVLARVCVAIVLAIGSAVELSAQRGAADALVALARGDYETAASILKPIAHSETSSDTAAQFLLAALYESGRGVPKDPLHACALYFRAAARSETPFGEQAERLLRNMVISRGPEFSGKCQALANLGFDHGFEPVTFDLAPGHSIAWDVDGATITYQGRTRTLPMRLAGRGAVYLPVRHTTLQSGGASPFARHFIEVFIWQPANAQTWALNWHLFEVVRDDVLRVADDDRLATRGDRPTPSEATDPRTLVSLRVNHLGIAEWQILAPGRERRGLIVRHLP